MYIKPLSNGEWYDIIWIPWHLLCTTLIYTISTGTAVRLVGGSTSYEGRVEVYYNGQWRSVCGTSSFGTDEATTVCRQLSYGYVSRSTRYYGSSSTTAYISCSGSESSVDSCGIGSSSCSSSYRQYVVCREPSEWCL